MIVVNPPECDCWILYIGRNIEFISEYIIVCTVGVKYRSQMSNRTTVMNRKVQGANSTAQRKIVIRLMIVRAQEQGDARRIDAQAFTNFPYIFLQ